MSMIGITPVEREILGCGEPNCGLDRKQTGILRKPGKSPIAKLAQRRRALEAIGFL